MEQNNNKRETPASREPGTVSPESYAAMYQKSARMSGIAFEMIVPALLGIGLDRLCGTVVLFMLLGVVAGGTLAFWQLLKFAKEESETKS